MANTTVASSTGTGSFDANVIADPLWLCTDLDGTLLGGDASARRVLYAALERHPDLHLVFVTGRGLESVLPLLSDPTLPTPDFVVADVGGTVVAVPSLAPVQPLQSDIDRRWPGAQAVLARLRGLPGLVRQDVPQERRCSFYATDPELIEEVAARVAPLDCHVLHSAGQYLDVLPAGVNKGATLSALLAQEGVEATDVLVAGDTLNDLTLFETGLPGVVVGNAEPALRAATASTPGVLQAEGAGAGGILEALRERGRIAAPDAAPAARGDAPLVVVYHRLPFDEVRRAGKVHRRRPRSPNGIIPTLLSFFGTGAPGAWVAWSLQPSREPEGFETHVSIDPESMPGVRAARIPLTQNDVTRFYKTFSKEALWPVIFSFLGQATFKDDDWRHYLEINRLFAERAAAEAADGALVWIHDYNLWMVPGYLRRLRPDVRIAFFHHTAFPPVDVFNVLPWRREIVGSLLQCDYVGFHIPRFAENFVDVLRAHAPVEIVRRVPCAPRFRSFGCALGLDTMTTAIRSEQRTIGIGAHPVGIDLERIATLLAAPGVQRRIADLRQEFGPRRTVLSLERLDYVKGPLEKLEAFEHLLEEHPDLHGQVVLINVCTPPAEGMAAYKAVRLKVDQAVGRINGRFSRYDWTPVRYFFRSLPFEDVLAHYAVADVAWITPLRDGLNLVAKEYVATKAASGGTGVLVLSEFAGAAVELHGALLTNPYGTTDMMQTLYRALTISDEERRDRLARLTDIVHHHDHTAWGREFLRAAETEAP